jgi:hypothetical protein
MYKKVSRDSRTGKYVRERQLERVAHGLDISGSVSLCQFSPETLNEDKILSTVSQASAYSGHVAFLWHNVCRYHFPLAFSV